MTRQEKAAFDKLFSYIYKENKEAADLSHKIMEICHTWDDLVDGDRPVPPEAVNSAFRGAFFDLQQSAIWVNCGIAHHVLNCYLRWRDANTIEGSDKKIDSDLHKTYMLRAGVYDIFVIIAYYLYGDGWAEQIGPVVRKFYGETLDDYLREIKNA